jgi:S1-C subfamily serine protease
MRNDNGHDSSTRSIPWLHLFLGFASGLVFAALFFVLGRLSASRDEVQSSPSAEASEPRAVIARGDLAQDETSTIALYQTVRPSVVNITTVSRRRDLFTREVQEEREGSGSGFIWNREGHIVTNAHVLSGGNSVVVTLADGSSWKGTVVGAHPDKDLAVVRISAPKEQLKPILVGTSEGLQVGQKTFAIGNPFGLEQTLTSGLISALNREIQSVTRRPIAGVIQTDAAINPGNSGGPLLDSAGRLIGVNTAIYSPSGASAGIGFAIPVDEVNRLVPQLIQHGQVVRPILGVRLANDTQASQWGIEGLVVLAVEPNGPAATAGIQGARADDEGRILLGDVLIAVNGKPLRKRRDLDLFMDQQNVGNRVTVTVRRQSDELEVEVKLGGMSP